MIYDLDILKLDEEIHRDYHNIIKLLEAGKKADAIEKYKEMKSSTVTLTTRINCILS